MKCKYYDICEHARPDALTCTEHGGGNYCGKYRSFLKLMPTTCRPGSHSDPLYSPPE